MADLEDQAHSTRVGLKHAAKCSHDPQNDRRDVRVAMAPMWESSRLEMASDVTRGHRQHQAPTVAP